MTISAALACLAAAILGSVITWLAMRSRSAVVVAEARAAFAAQKSMLEGSIRNVEEATRRQAMDEFLADIRVEERHYVREHKVLFLNRKLLVRQERIFFRNIPLSNWVEQEMPIEEGADMDKLAKAMSVFSANLLTPDQPGIIRKLLH